MAGLEPPKNSDALHLPVMLAEVLAAAQPLKDALVVDGTFGAGGYSQAILDEGVAGLMGIDQDLSAVAIAKQRFKDTPKFQIAHGNFADLNHHLDEAKPPFESDSMDAVILDLGVSSMQLDQQERGFSFRFDGPLDMRMDDSQGETAADIVNTRDEVEIADILYRYGEERKSRHIARAIFNRRQEAPFTRTQDLADVIRGVVGMPRQKKGGKKPIDPATRSFQGLRIAVNDELGVIHKVLDQSIDALKSGGRLVVVTFHSLEDRIVKNFLKSACGLDAAPNRFMPQSETVKPLFELTSRKAVKPTQAEIDENPRARSAKLRSAIRTSLPRSESTFVSQVVV